MAATKQELRESVTPYKEGPTVTMGLKELAAKRVEEFKKEETKMVKGVFHNYETPGAAATILIQKYKDVPMFKQSMMDGFTYEIPLYVARFLNGIDVMAGALAEKKDPEVQKIGTCSYAVHGFKMGPDGKLADNVDGSDGIPVPIVGVAKRVKRYGFSGMDFAAPQE